VKNLGNFKLFVTKRAFFFKNQGFQAFLEAISVSFLLKTARFFHKLRFLSISGPYFRFLWQNSSTFCQNTEVKP